MILIFQSGTLKQKIEKKNFKTTDYKTTLSKKNKATTRNMLHININVPGQ